MISYIRGVLSEINEDTIIVETNGGIGFEIFVSTYTINLLPPIGSEVLVHTILSHKEDAMELYGFYSKDELKIFKLLLKVNGVGNKSALSITSTFSPDDLRFAILGEDFKAISKAPGIGAKTAQRIVLELKDKIDLLEAFENKISSTTSVKSNDVKQEAMLALTALGYSSSMVMKVLNSIEVDDNTDCDELISEVLRQL